MTNWLSSNPFESKTVEIEVFGRWYQATLYGNDVVDIFIFADGHWRWACQGRFEGGQIVDCAAELWSGDADRTESVYEALDEALA